jgi:hypothetical protein
VRGLPYVPSVLGGSRPSVNDDADITRRKIAYLRPQVADTRAKLAKLEAELGVEEKRLDKAKRLCKNCGNCTACR